MTTIKLQLPPALIERLEAREDTYHPSPGRPSAIPMEPLRKASSRYFSLIEKELAGVAATLSAGEASVICDALNGSACWDWGCLGEFSAASTLRVELHDACHPSIGDLARKWGVDPIGFLEKVDAWSESQALAVVDAVERFWANPQTSTVQGVGLTLEGAHDGQG